MDIYDSDIATITYSPAAGAGLVYLGRQPRDYFEDPSASSDVDLDGEADGLAAWAQLAVASDVNAETIRALLAEDGVEEPLDLFVEETVIKLLLALRLPIPPELEVEG